MEDGSAVMRFYFVLITQKYVTIELKGDESVRTSPFAALLRNDT